MAADLSDKQIGTSVGLGIASTAPVAGLVHSECARPSGLTKRPCFRRCCRRVLRFTRRSPFRAQRRRGRREASLHDGLPESVRWLLPNLPALHLSFAPVHWRRESLSSTRYVDRR